MRVPVTTLNDGYDFPLLGLGTYKLQGDDVETIVRSAIELGYRHIDTASLYGNEVEVGKAINDAIKAGDVTREDLFVTTKLWNDDQERVAAAYQESLERLGLEFVDLYLVHWPWPQHGTYVQAFEQIAELQGDGAPAVGGRRQLLPGGARRDHREDRGDAGAQPGGAARRLHPA